MNLNLKEIRKNKDRVGIMCHNQAQALKVRDILGVKVTLVVNSWNEIVILSAQNCEIVHPTESGYIFVQASDFIEANQPLFTSEDGVPIYPNSLCWCWNHFTDMSTLICGQLVNINNSYTGHGWKIFSSKEARDQYVRKNKTYFITSDGVEIKLGDTYWFVDQSGDIYKNTESGMHKKSETLNYFSSYEKAKEYQENNRFKLITYDGVTITDPGQKIYGITSGVCVTIFASQYLHKNWEKDLIFSTKEARSKYIDHIKLKYSDADLETFFKATPQQDIGNNSVEKQMAKFKQMVGI